MISSSHPAPRVVVRVKQLVGELAERLAEEFFVEPRDVGVLVRLAELLAFVAIDGDAIVNPTNAGAVAQYTV